MQLTFSNTVYTKANQNKKSHDLHPDTLGTVIFTDNLYVNNCACHVIVSYHSYIYHCDCTNTIHTSHSFHITSTTCVSFSKNKKIYYIQVSLSRLNPADDHVTLHVVCSLQYPLNTPIQTIHTYI